MTPDLWAQVIAAGATVLATVAGTIITVWRTGVIQTEALNRTAKFQADLARDQDERRVLQEKYAEQRAIFEAYLVAWRDAHALGASSAEELSDAALVAARNARVVVRMTLSHRALVAFDGDDARKAVHDALFDADEVSSTPPATRGVTTNERDASDSRAKLLMLKRMSGTRLALGLAPIDLSSFESERDRIESRTKPATKATPASAKQPRTKTRVATADAASRARKRADPAEAEEFDSEEDAAESAPHRRREI